MARDFHRCWSSICGKAAQPNVVDSVAWIHHFAFARSGVCSVCVSGNIDCGGSLLLFACPSVGFWFGGIHLSASVCSNVTMAGGWTDGCGDGSGSAFLPKDERLADFR